MKSMKSIKLMLTGLMLALIGNFFVNTSSVVPFILLGLGVIVFLVGIAIDLFGDWTKKF